VFLLGACLLFVAEVFAFVAVGEHIGFGWAVLLLIGVSVLGPFLVKRVGLGVLARTQKRLDLGELPSRELLDGVVVLAAGVLICVPGFITDALGLLLLISPVRHVLIRWSGRWLARRVQTVRPVGRQVIDVNTWSASGDRPPGTEPTPLMIEPERRPARPEGSL
jgi:UPF0716 protein FxsA